MVRLSPTTRRRRIISDPLARWVIFVLGITVLVAGDLLFEQRLRSKDVGEKLFQPSTGAWVILNAVWLVLLGATIRRLIRSTSRFSAVSFLMLLMGLLVVYFTVWKFLFPIYLDTL